MSGLFARLLINKHKNDLNSLVDGERQLIPTVRYLLLTKLVRFTNTENAVAPRGERREFQRPVFSDSRRAAGRFLSPRLSSGSGLSEPSSTCSQDAHHNIIRNSDINYHI